MNNFNKYFGLMALLFGGFVGFILLVIVIFYLLKLCSVTLFYVPGFDNIFHYTVICIPYIIFFSGYYYLHKKTPASTKIVSRILARIFLTIGCVTCFAGLVISTIKFAGARKEWVNTFEENSHYLLILQIVILFLTAGILAAGDAKEKNWMEK